MSAASGSSPNRHRRRLLVGAGLVGGAFALGVWGLVRPRDRLSPPDAFRPEDGSHRLTAWLRVGADGTITVQVPYQEMGQGITTALPMLVAEEMDADWASVRFENAAIDPVYANATVVGDGVPLRPDDHGWPARLMRHGQWRFGQLLGVQATGGSTGLRDAWEPVRLAGTTARTMLVHAAAARFDVRPEECTTADGAVHHLPTGRRTGYGELAAIASALPIPHDVTPRARADFRLLGKPRPRLDIPAKVDGSAVFSSDVRLPGQLYAAIVQCPVLGGALRSVEAGRARARPGVRAVVELPATSTSAAAVAVVAERFWQAKTAADLLDIIWEPGPAAAYASEAERARQQAALAGAEARVYDEAGEVEHGLAAPARFLDLSYRQHRFRRQLRGLGRQPVTHPGEVVRGESRRYRQRPGAGAHPLPGRRLRPARRDGCGDADRGHRPSGAWPPGTAALDTGGRHPPRRLPPNGLGTHAGSAGCRRSYHRLVGPGGEPVLHLQLHRQAVALGSLHRHEGQDHPGGPVRPAICTKGSQK
jgi:CO/xanthine dehydrogenase Mo-binding subunit